jgi:YD repeat-containing protein
LPIINIFRNMKTRLFILFLCFSQLCQSQTYYYIDIIGTKDLGERMKGYINNNVKSISATGYDPQGVKTSDFNEWQQVDAGKRILTVITRNGQQVTRQYYRFDDQFRLTSITDTSGNVHSVSAYVYDAAGNLTSIKINTSDSLFSEIVEHQWKYNTAGKPAKMWRITNGKDSLEYRFTIDESGNVADESLYRAGLAPDPVYYYYDEKHRLTDIVRYNKRAKKLLADFMFEYDESNRVIQKITTLSTINPDYLIWRYLYNDQGLKTKEALFNKQKDLNGRIEYQYTFNQ